VTTTDAATTTAAPETTAAATTAPPDVPDPTAAAMWPWETSDLRFDDPIAAATSFATDFLAFVDPVVGEFRQGDSRSGEVTIQSFTDGPETVVFVRQLTDDDSWWVLGAAAENITIDEPEQGAVIESPFTVAGTALAFEGTIQVEIRADGDEVPVFESFVTATGGLDLGPYLETFEWTSPGTGGGALVLFSLSSEDGSVIEASALRVAFG
jgi:hypothetical protein